jgi:hypothetical protein
MFRPSTKTFDFFGVHAQDPAGLATVLAADDDDLVVATDLWQPW